jgi:Mg-chelatase subunit ChlD
VDRYDTHTYYRLLSQLGTDFSGASRPAQSPIVLPAAPSETGLALKDSKDVQLIAAANQPAATPDLTQQHEQKVREAQKKVDDLRAGLNISDTVANGEGPSPLMTAETLRKLESLRIESKAELDREQTLLGRLKELGKAQGTVKLAQALPSAAADSVLSSLLEQRAVAEQKQSALEREYGSTHSEFLKSKALAEDLDTKIKSRVDSIMPGLDARIMSLKSGLDNFEREVAQAKTNDVAEANRTRPYFEAKRTLEDLQRSREVLRKSETANANQTKQADVTSPKPVASAPIPQPEVQTSDKAFSTFSLNVSDVSFKLAAASLEKGLMPEPATVRSEEFINAFDYRDPEPPPGVPVAFAWERAQYPFAQNRDLLRFSIKTAALGRQPGRALNIVLLLDNSGSMERADRVRIIREALRVLAGQLQPQDIFSVVTFARTAHLWVDGVPGSQAAQVAEQVSGLTPEGGTNLEDAMDLAYQTALRHYLASGVNRVVLLTDGAANLGTVEPEALKQKVEAHRKQGVALDCFGIGWEGYNDDLLEVLARNGDGRYAFLNSPEEVASEFAAKLAGALQVAASDVKVQVEFNAGRVTAYRQIGYAKHQLTKEQFRDNTVNAAQIGAAEAGNALHTVEVNPAGTGPLCTVRVRFRIPGTQDYREHAWDVPFAGNAVALEQASPAMRLAATASALSEWLASSPYAGEVTTDRLLGYLSGVPEVYGADARPKKLEWMIRQAKSIAGK